MGNIMVRMGMVIAIVIGVQMGFLYVGHLKHPEIVEPPRPIEDFPMVVNTAAAGTWEGKDAKLPEREFNESEVSKAVSRTYTNREGQSMSFLLAEYLSPSVGLYHNPMNCYHTHGFVLAGSESRPLKAANCPDIDIRITTWVQTGKKVIVAYWYEVGDYSMYERWDLWRTQWGLFGRTKWPVMFKVLLEMPVVDAEQSKTELLDMAQYVREWLGNNRPVID